jgi:type II secretory pathway component PulJ
MELKNKNALQRIEYLQRELEYLKRDLMLLEMKPEIRMRYRESNIYNVSLSI